MKLEERIDAFQKLGMVLEHLPEPDFQSIASQARQQNPWFTEADIQMAVRGIVRMLNPNALKAWTRAYNFDIQPMKIAVVMAGNIPMVGFHDFLCVMLSGHNILIKCSSKDQVLIEYLANQLITIEPRFRSRIAYADQLKGFDGIIATGSDNTSRYFEYYFGKYPNIIRKNRTSVAILHGGEQDEELTTLGMDVFSYYGLGCRSVSKVFLPQGFPLEKLLRCWEPYHEIIHHHKYHNNYDYQKSVLLLTQVPFLDNGFVMLSESDKLVSPIAIVYYEFYQDRNHLDLRLQSVTEKIQCVVENTPQSPLKFGQAQFPSPGDYADQIDTLKFLTELA
jgi:hypothetical protein